MSEPTYLAFFLTETDGDVGYRQGTLAELQLWCHQEGRRWKEDIILVEGQIVKDEGSGVIKGRTGPYKPRL